MKKINFFLIPLILSACATSKKVEIANDLLPVLDTSVSYTLKRSVIEVPNDSQTYKLHYSIIHYKLILPKSTI